MSNTGGDISSFLRGLDLADRRVRRGVTTGVNDVMAMTFGNAQSYCPIDWGTLAASETQEPARFNALGTEVTATGGFNTSYAAAVHENLTANHVDPPRRKVNGKASTRARNPKAQAKFLERAVRETAPKVAPHLAKRVSQALQGGESK